MNNPQDHVTGEISTFVNDALSVKIRASLDTDGSPLFVGRDVALALGYAKPNNAIQAHCKGALKWGTLQTEGGTQEMRMISEGDMYRLVANSKLPTAQKFESWVFDEVLPQIRRTGGYIPAAETPAQTMARAVLIAQKTIEQQQAQIEAQKPKVLFADALAAGQSSILVGELAKILRQNGVDVGQNRLFGWLRQHHYLQSRRGEGWNMPTQRSMENGLFEIKTSTRNNPDGSTFAIRTPKVTAKGQQYFISKFINHHERVEEAE